MPEPAAVRVACRRIGAAVRADPRYAHTSHLRVLTALPGGQVARVASPPSGRPIPTG